jgi:hypothetical protein
MERYDPDKTWTRVGDTASSDAPMKTEGQP